MRVVTLPVFAPSPRPTDLLDGPDDLDPFGFEILPADLAHCCSECDYLDGMYDREREAMERIGNDFNHPEA